MWLKEQISSYINEKKIYGNQGDEVKLICEYGNVSIVELNGERFAVNIEKLSKTFVAKPAEVIQVNYPPTAKPMGGASRVNAPTNVGNLP